MKSILLTIFTILSIFSCTAQNKNAKKTNTKSDVKSANTAISTKNLKENNSDMQNTILFKEGENKFLKEYDMNVTFEKILEESRCPTKVDCVWKGVATVEITLMGTFTRPLKIKLSTVEDQKKGYNNSAIFNGYKISLVDLSPYPNSTKSFKENTRKYELKLQFNKIAENQIEPNTR